MGLAGDDTAAVELKLVVGGKRQPEQGPLKKVGDLVSLKQWTGQEGGPNNGYELLAGRIVEEESGPTAKKNQRGKHTGPGAWVGVQVEGRDGLIWKMKKHVKRVEQESNE